MRPVSMESILLLFPPLVVSITLFYILKILIQKSSWDNIFSLQILLITRKKIHILFSFELREKVLEKTSFFQL